MKSSNLAERLEPEDLETAPPPTQAAPPRDALDAACAPRPRRSLGFRSIVIHDQGFTPFRVS